MMRDYYTIKVGLINYTASTPVLSTSNVYIVFMSCGVGFSEYNQSHTVGMK